MWTSYRYKGQVWKHRDGGGSVPAEGYTGDTECKKRDIILIVCRDIIRKATW